MVRFILFWPIFNPQFPILIRREQPKAGVAFLSPYRNASFDFRSISGLIPAPNNFSK